MFTLKRTAMRLVILMLVCFITATCHAAGGGFIDAGDESNWSDDGVSVIVAQFSDLKPDPGRGAPQPWHATLTPLVTVAGKFDPSAKPVLSVRLFSGNPSAIRTLPKDGDTVLAVIAVNLIQGDEVVPSDWISVNSCSFMPGGSSPLIVIDGLADKRVGETLDRIRKARATARTQRDDPAKRRENSEPKKKTGKGEASQCYEARE